MSEENQVDTQDPVVQEALSQGWVPQERWTGAPEEWSDAETFVKRGREINPILRKSLEKERAKTAKLEADLAEVRAVVNDLTTNAAEREKMIYDRAQADLKAQLRNARAEGDFERAAEVEDALDTLRANPPKEPKKVAAPTQPQLQPEVASWMAANSWYNETQNPELCGYANGQAAKIVREAQARGETVDINVALAEVTARVKKAFPNYFGGGAAMFEGSGGAGSPAAASRSTEGGRGFNSLPAEGKAQFERLRKAGGYKGMSDADAKAAFYEQVSRYGA